MMNQISKFKLLQMSSTNLTIFKRQIIHLVRTTIYINIVDRMNRFVEVIAIIIKFV